MKTIPFHAVVFFLLCYGGTALFAQVSPEADSLEEKDLERRGPANISFEILNQIQSDHEFESQGGIINIFRKVYRDANPRSGYFYYLPASYTLNWKEEIAEYAFYINYLAANDQGRGSAVLTAELKPNISRQDIALARSLLSRDVKQDQVANQFEIRNLVSMPLAAPPKINFSQIRNYGVNPEDIIVRTPTDFLDPIVISWRMDRVDDLLSALFNNVGLNGNITLEPDGDDMPVVEIPINLKIDDAGTFGVFDMDEIHWRSQGWQNPTDFPVILKNMHVLMMDESQSSSIPKIYTWNTGNVEVPEQAQVDFQANAVPTWLESHPKVKKIWMEYTVAPCNSCNSTVKDKILGGVAGNQIINLEITTLSPLAFTGAQMMKIRIRSVQADPNGARKIVMNPVTIQQDGASLVAGQLFIDYEEKPDFEYLIQLYMADGTKYESPRWIQSHDTEIVIGEKQIRESITHFNQ